MVILLNFMAKSPHSDYQKYFYCTRNPVTLRRGFILYRTKKTQTAYRYKVRDNFLVFLSEKIIFIQSYIRNSHYMMQGISGVLPTVVPDNVFCYRTSSLRQLPIHKHTQAIASFRLRNEQFSTRPRKPGTRRGVQVRRGQINELCKGLQVVRHTSDSAD